MTILEPCCKISQFDRLLKYMKALQKEDFAYYGDVAFNDWFSRLLLENRNSDVTIHVRTLDFYLLNYLCKKMKERALNGVEGAMMLNTVHIVVDSEDFDSRANIKHLPSDAQPLADAGRLTISEAEKEIKQDKIVLQNDQWQFTMQGSIFLDEQTARRTVSITKKAAQPRKPQAPAPSAKTTETTANHETIAKNEEDA